MTKAVFEGRKVEVVDDWQLGEQIEAENALKIDFMESTGMAKMAVIMFISLRRVDSQTPVAVLADKVLSMNFTAFADMTAGDDELPPPNGAVVAPGSIEEENEPRTTGLPHSATIST